MKLYYNTVEPLDNMMSSRIVFFIFFYLSKLSEKKDEFIHEISLVMARKLAMYVYGAFYAKSTEFVGRLVFIVLV